MLRSSRNIQKAIFVNILAYSEGGIITRNALDMLNEIHPGWSEKIRVYTFGSPVIYDRELAGHIEQYICKKDAVTWLDLIGRMQDHPHVIVLDPIEGQESYHSFGKGDRI